MGTEKNSGENQKKNRKVIGLHAPMSALWSKAEAGGLDKGVDLLLVFQIQVTTCVCLTWVRPRFNLYHQIITSTHRSPWVKS